MYLDDYLYIIGRDRIAVLDENTWEKVSELEFTMADTDKPMPG